MIICCLLKSGGIYKPEHVYRIQKQIEKNVHCEYEFLCFTDMKVECATVPLILNLPAQWSKIEIFRPNVAAHKRQKHMFYLDLDTTILDDITHIITAKGFFFILRDFAKALKHRPASGLLSFSDKGREYVWDQWLRNKKNLLPIKKDFGLATEDREFFWKHIKRRMLFQDLFPDEIVSWKKHCQDGIPEKAKIICFHGTPRPWEVGQ